MFKSVSCVLEFSANLIPFFPFKRCDSSSGLNSDVELVGACQAKYLLQTNDILADSVDVNTMLKYREAMEACSCGCKEKST